MKNRGGDRLAVGALRRGKRVSVEDLKKKKKKPTENEEEAFLFFILSFPFQRVVIYLDGFTNPRTL